MDAKGRCDIAPVPWHILKPYLSVIVLECVDDDPAVSFGVLCRQLERSGRQRAGKRSEVIARSELTRAAGDIIDGAGSLDRLQIDQVFGCIRRTMAPPSWATDSAEFLEAVHHLVLAVRCGRLVAVRADENTAGRLQRWLDKPGHKQLHRIDGKVLEATFMAGAAKGLWLRQVQPPSRQRPKSKATTGIDLGKALDSIEDSNFAMSAARCEMPKDRDVVFLNGAVGVTLRDSLVWFKDSPDLRTYLMTASEVLQLVEAGLKSGATGADHFSKLAQEETDLTQVSGAFEVSPIDPDSLPVAAAGGEERQAAAALLQNAVLKVREGSRTDRFLLDVGLDGVIGGTLAVKLRPSKGGFALDVGFDRNSGEPLRSARQVQKALKQGDLIEIYYESGHKYSGGKIWRQNFTPVPFPNWEWADFADIVIEREKPEGRKAPQDIHKAIACNGDNSLFAWVAQTYTDGWLICDDGSGEAADFFHLSNDDVLSVIHVKAASSAARGRRVSVSDYEVVVSQAVKNLFYTDRERLLKRLAKTTLSQPACWVQGKRTGTRAEFLDMLAASRATGRTEIVIVQPHLRQLTYQRLMREEAGLTDKQDQLRLRLLEMLLHVARASCVRYGLELKVIGSKN